MTLLAKLHLVIVAGVEIVARHSAVGIMAGDAVEFAAFAAFRGIRRTRDWMAFARTERGNMNPFADPFVTGKTERVDRLVQLTRIFTRM